MRKVNVAVAVVIGAFAIWLYFKFAREGRFPSAEQRIAGLLSARLELYAYQNAGAWPRSWSQLTNLDEPNKYLFSEKSVVIPELFAFLPTNVPIAGFYEGELLLIQSKPNKEYRRLGRHFVFYSSDLGTLAFRAARMSEQEVQALFSKYGLQPPQSSPEEIRLARERAIEALAEERATERQVQELAPK